MIDVAEMVSLETNVALTDKEEFHLIAYDFRLNHKSFRLGETRGAPQDLRIEIGKLQGVWEELVIWPLCNQSVANDDHSRNKRALEICLEGQVQKALRMYAFFSLILMNVPSIGSHRTGFCER